MNVQGGVWALGHAVVVQEHQCSLGVPLNSLKTVSLLVSSPGADRARKALAVEVWLAKLFG